jgi:3-hydroxymyristoyl/3-hydroxydecanoyl-(acyl carrier protein) dehydratase
MMLILPEVLGVPSQTPRGVRLCLRLPAELWYFQGHFPGAGILPAVVQLDWAMHYAKELLGVSGTFTGMDRLKFRRVLRPGDEPELQLEHRPDKQRLEFSYSTLRGRHSSGQLWIS